MIKVTIKDIVTNQQTRTARNSHTLKEKDHTVVSSSSPSSVPPRVPGSTDQCGHTGCLITDQKIISLSDTTRDSKSHPSAMTMVQLKKRLSHIIIVVQLLSCVQLFATLWTAALQASLPFTISGSLLKCDAIQPSQPLSLLFPPALNFSQHQGLFQRVGSLHEVVILHIFCIFVLAFIGL